MSRRWFHITETRFVQRGQLLVELTLLINFFLVED